MGGVVVLLVVIVLVLWVLASCIRIVHRPMQWYWNVLVLTRLPGVQESISRFRSLSVLQEE